MLLTLLNLLYLIFCFSASRQTCDPKEVTDNPWIYLSEMLIGCWTSFIREDKAEVHILNLNFLDMVSGE